jgi:murein DD-endopeptidase MepM/ murein hydrolase activator NlpD
VKWGGAGIATCVAALAAAGCAHGAAKQSFAEAGFVEPTEPDGPPPPPVALPAPRSPAVKPRELPPGPPVDVLLLPFAGQARARRGRTPAGQGFPAEAVQAWADLAGRLGAYEGRAVPLLELVRARVTIESELEFDHRRYGAVPPEVEALLLPRLAWLAGRAEAVRAQGGRLFLLEDERPPSLRWPIQHAGLSSGFGMRLHPLDGERRMHWGIDLAAAPGRVVTSAAEGVVVQAGWMGGYGWLVEVRHPGEITSRYSHLSRIMCHPGDPVEPGQALGLVGQTGRATGPHLHFEVWEGGKPRDPLAFLAGRLAMAGGGN